MVRYLKVNVLPLLVVVTGIEAAIDLAGVVEHVTVLEFAPELKADSVLQQKHVA